MQSQVSPVSGTTTYSYDAAGNLTKSVDARQAQNQPTDKTTRDYDAANRIVSSIAVTAGSTENVSWAYDETCGQTPCRPRYGAGRLTSMTDPSGSTKYSYERRGLLRNEAKTIDLNTYTLSYGYDSNGNRSSITYPSGRVVVYTFDFADRPYSAAYTPLAGPGTTYVSSASYHPFGPETSIAYGNRTTKTVTYDQRYRPSENKLAGSSTIYDYKYREGAVGNIQSICDVSVTCTTDPIATYDRVFAYDDLNRLTTARSGSLLWGSASGNGFTYDSMGNVKTITLGTSRTANFTYSGTTPSFPW